jgi:anti-sigma B factor antagonist
MTKTRTLNISVRAADNPAVVDLDGRIDLGNSTTLRTTLFKIVEVKQRVVLNMTGVRYIDSSGIATLIEALKKAHDLRKDFVLFGVPEAVSAVLKLTNLLGVFRIADSEADALDS